jgi:hypothetical protein
MPIANMNVAGRIKTIVPFFNNTVTYKTRTGIDAFTDTTITGFHVRPITDKEMNLPEIILCQADMLFEVTNQTTPFTPQVDDQFVDANNVLWIIKLVKAKMNSTVYDLFCQRGVA